MRKWELIKQGKLLKIKSKILSNLFNENYGLKLGEFNNTTGLTVAADNNDNVFNLYGLSLSMKLNIPKLMPM